MVRWLLKCLTHGPHSCPADHMNCIDSIIVWISMCKYMETHSNYVLYEREAQCQTWESRRDGCTFVGVSYCSWVIELMALHCGIYFCWRAMLPGGYFGDWKPHWWGIFVIMPCIASEYESVYYTNMVISVTVGSCSGLQWVAAVMLTKAVQIDTLSYMDIYTYNTYVQRVSWYQYLEFHCLCN